MSKITVYLLNFYGIKSHTEIILKNLSDETYYLIDRWQPPAESFSQDKAGRFQRNILRASSVFHFDIEKNPDYIAQQWSEHYNETKNETGLVTHNCAVSVQWFLTTFADIPDPSFFSAPITFNHLACGFFWPSIIPIGVTLPGRVMSHAKFYIQARNNPESFSQYTDQFLRLCLAMSVIVFSISVLGLMTAPMILDNTSRQWAQSVGTVTTLASTCGFFMTSNAYATKETIKKIKDGVEPRFTKSP